MSLRFYSPTFIQRNKDKTPALGAPRQGNFLLKKHFVRATQNFRS